MNELDLGLTRYLSPDARQQLKTTCIGIAGLGGLGSNIATILTRTGIGQFVLIDYDTVEPSNLNRQTYLPKDVGKLKIAALHEQLIQLSPSIHCTIVKQKLSRESINDVLDSAPIWVEAFDGAETKAMFVEACLLQGKRVVSASGLAGYGGEPLQRKDYGRLVLIGDGQSDIAKAPPLAPRVIWAAAWMADVVLEWVLKGMY